MTCECKTLGRLWSGAHRVFECRPWPAAWRTTSDAEHHGQFSITSLLTEYSDPDLSLESVTLHRHFLCKLLQLRLFRVVPKLDRFRSRSARQVAVFTRPSMLTPRFRQFVNRAQGYSSPHDQTLQAPDAMCLLALALTPFNKPQAQNDKKRGVSKTRKEVCGIAWVFLSPIRSQPCPSCLDLLRSLAVDQQPASMHSRGRHCIYCCCTYVFWSLLRHAPATSLHDTQLALSCQICKISHIIRYVVSS